MGARFFLALAWSAIALLPGASSIADDGALDCPAVPDRTIGGDSPMTAEVAALSSASLDTLVQGERISKDSECYASVGEVVRSLANDGAVLVDIRAPRVFGRYRIGGSLNISPPTLKTKTFLSKKPVVLVDEGHGYRHLEQLCNSLRKAGFESVKILDGGLNAWRQQVGPLDGDAAARRELLKISPAEFFQERRYGHWVLVDLGEKVADVEADDASGGGQQSGGKVDVVRERLNAAVGAAEAGTPEPFLLAVTGDGAGFDVFLAAVRGTGLVHAYFLDGGRAGYRAVPALAAGDVGLPAPDCESKGMRAGRVGNCEQMFHGRNFL